MTEQTAIDFEAAADTVILVAIDGREVELPRRDLVVAAGPDGKARDRYILPESMLEPAPRGPQPPPRRPPNRTGKS